MPRSSAEWSRPCGGQVGVHTTGSPPVNGVLETSPAGVVHGQPRVHRTAFLCAVPKSSLHEWLLSRLPGHERPATATECTPLAAGFDEAESERHSGDGERDPNSARHGREHGQGRTSHRHFHYGLLSCGGATRESKDVQRNPVAPPEEWAASAVRVKTKILVGMKRGKMREWASARNAMAMKTR